MGENVYGKSSSCPFHNFEALNDAFEVQLFQGLTFASYQRHW